jgi:hypothetical protein
MWLRCMFILNITLLFILVIIFIIAFKNETEDSYIRFGPSKSLNIMSFYIDTWNKWFITVFMLSVIEIADVFISETAINKIYNDIYNTEVLYITNFSNETQLQVYSQLMYGINSLRYILTVKISVTQVDFAIINVLVSRLVSIKTIHENVKHKNFIF